MVSKQKQIFQKMHLIKSAKKEDKESSSDMIIANDIGKKYQKNPKL